MAALSFDTAAAKSDLQTSFNKYWGCLCAGNSVSVQRDLRKKNIRSTLYYTFIGGVNGNMGQGHAFVCSGGWCADILQGVIKKRNLPYRSYTAKSDVINTLVLPPAKWQIAQCVRKTRIKVVGGSNTLSNHWAH